MASPTALPTCCQLDGLVFTTVTVLPETITSLTARPGIPKMLVIRGESWASAADVKRRAPPSRRGTGSTNRQRVWSVGSAVIRISAIRGELSPRVRDGSTATIRRPGASLGHAPPAPPAQYPSRHRPDSRAPPFLHRPDGRHPGLREPDRSEEHTSELQSHVISYAV